ncbi:hypothetical protein [Arenimonas sp. MALMAid1274]|jgi:hypothetical protein|uniref:hypothetical protein n=1 Tax=Arenimonas sp. MALMAid1274 TaxID=3411630 RepID=UPI003BA1EE31
MSHPQRRGPPRKDVKIQVRVERPLAERLQHAAAENGLEPSDKLRRILDAVLPPLPNKNAA